MIFRRSSLPAFFAILFASHLMIFGQEPAPQRSTTGPIPPTSVAPPSAHLAEPGGASRTISGVPSYMWRHGCGPTAVGMVLGYWAGHGLPDLFVGDASTQTENVNQGIASEGSGVRGIGTQLHYEDYGLPDDSGTSYVLADSSVHYPNGCHSSNSIADFMHTSWSVDGNHYGWSSSAKIIPAFTSYATLRNSTYVPQATAYYMNYSPSLTWSVLTTEIDNNRPMVFLVDSDGDGQTDHFVTVVGYDSNTQQYASRDTWYSAIRWEPFRSMSSSYSWGVWGGWSFRFITRAIRLGGDLTFGNTTVGQTAGRTLTIYNDGSSSLSVSSISYPAGFSGNWSSGTIPAGGSQPLTVTFAPSAAQSYGGTITVNSDKTSGTNTIACSGTGTAITRIIGLSGSLAFPSVRVGSVMTATLTINNTGNSTLTVSGISYPTGFSGNWSSGTIAAGGSQLVTVTFAPTAAQTYSGTITVNSDKTSGTNTILTSGTGINRFRGQLTSD